MPNSEGILSIEIFESHLKTLRLGQMAIFLPQVPSTNDYLMALPAAQSPHGTLIAADLQVAGKGRLGRRWVTPAGSSLLFSVNLCALAANREYPPTWLTMMAGISVVRAVESACQLDVSLKWPNDIVVMQSGQPHKLGGILVEVEFEGEQLKRAVVGIGLNVNIDSAELPPSATQPTSLSILLGRKVERERLLAEILLHLELLLAQVQKNAVDIVGTWRDCLVTIGRSVTATSAATSAATGAQAIDGIAETVDRWGQLGIRDDDGVLHFVAAGDVTLRQENLS